MSPHVTRPLPDPSPASPARRTVRRALHGASLVAFLATALGAGSLRVAGAQSVSPPVEEYTDRASASFVVTNTTITPLVVVLDVRGFVIDEAGMLTDVPLDTARVKVQLSEMSFRLPPRASRTIFYDASAGGGPAWFQVIATFTGARASNGLNLRIELPHVVYLNQRQALARGDVALRSARYDDTAHVVTLELENVSGRLGRVRSVSVGGRGARAAGPPMPLFPNSRRRVTIAWTGDSAPTAVAAKFDGFTLEAPIGP